MPASPSKMLAIAPEYYHTAPPKDQPAVGTLPDSRLPSNVPRPKLLESLTIPRGSGTFTLKNRASIAPMCMYSSRDGFPTPFHIAHHGQFALHGAGSIVVEASAVTPQGRISPEDLGMYQEEHVAAHASLVATIKAIAPGVYFGIQLAHSGRKASTRPPYDYQSYETPYATEEEGGWPKDAIGASALPYADKHIVPHQLTLDEVHKVEDSFVLAAERAYRAGYDFVEVHSAHGYLISSFNSPLSNKRTDEYGGSFENRTRLLRTIVRRIRESFPDKGLWVRVNGTDAVEHTQEDSWTIESTRQLAPLLEEAGVDVLDVSSGGIVDYNRFEHIPGYQLPLAAALKSLGLKKMLISSVGVLQDGTEAEPTKAGLFAEEALQKGKADIISVGRGALRSPNWVEEAARSLVGSSTAGALQYDYAITSLGFYKFPQA